MVTINNASSAIQWSVIRKNSAFLHKRRGVNKYFSSDKFNLSGLYTNRSSGISNDSGVSVRAASEKKTLVVELKKRSSGAQRKPITATSIVKFTGGPRRVVQKVGALVKSYEPSLSVSAQRRAAKLLRSIHNKKSGGKRRNKTSSV